MITSSPLRKADKAAAQPPTPPPAITTFADSSEEFCSAEALAANEIVGNEVKAPEANPVAPSPVRLIKFLLFINFQFLTYSH